MSRARILSLIGLAVGISAVIVALSYWAMRPEIPDFRDYEAGAERKEAFFSYFLPLVQQRNHEIEQLRQRLELWSRDPDALNWWRRNQVEEVAATYRMEGFDLENPQHWEELLRRVDVVPPSLALAQAANESAWGTSRFARKGNNYFGQWCFREGCGLVPQSRDAGKNHEVAAFESPRESVERYIRNINTHRAYRQLRLIRAELRTNDELIDGPALAPGLTKYSERGEEYIKELRSMIRHNELTQYDQ